MAGKKRGRPRKVRPVFEDPDAEMLRVEGCIKEGRDPYPPIKYGPCKAELELRKDVRPGVPFALVVQLNDTDFDGFPLDHPAAEAAWDEAQAKRVEAARSGGEQRSRLSLAAEIVNENADYIRTKRAEGWSKSRILKYIKARQISKGQPCAGRTAMYNQMAALRL